ncbi:hypothetical protein DL95DRAFT_21569 [Leptodontidium sp. 2 PMI_412]|nr:hypothetical protein DL95DRAFT_21569 [Leptodontidium sp. 2 PMI_412]
MEQSDPASPPTSRLQYQPAKAIRKSEKRRTQRRPNDPRSFLICKRGQIRLAQQQSTDAKCRKRACMNLLASREREKIRHKEQKKRRTIVTKAFSCCPLSRSIPSPKVKSHEPKENAAKNNLSPAHLPKYAEQTRKRNLVYWVEREVSWYVTEREGTFKTRF